MTPRAKMADYMAELRRTVGYESLKSQYLKQFPSLQAETTSNMEEPLDDESEEVVPSNPIELRDAKIVELEKNVADMNDMKESLLKMKAELKIAVKTANIANAKVKFARNITEERLKECLPDPSFEDKHSQVIVALMSSLLDEDSFEIDPETDSLKPKDNFLKDVEDSLDIHKEDQEVKQRLEGVKNKLLDRVKSAPNRFRRLSMSSAGSGERKRKGSTELVNDSTRSRPSPST